MIVDLLLTMVGTIVELTIDVIPRPDPGVVSFARSAETGGAQLGQVPYSNLLPWTAIGLMAQLIPSVMVTCWAIEWSKRMLAWLRSRGTSSE